MSMEERMLCRTTVGTIVFTLVLIVIFKPFLTFSKDDSRSDLVETLKKLYHPKRDRVAFQKWDPSVFTYISIVV